MGPLVPASVTVRSCDVGLQGKSSTRPPPPVRTSRQSKAGVQATWVSPSIAAPIAARRRVLWWILGTQAAVSIEGIIDTTARQCCP
jgi:hypothetical protein